MKRRITFAMVLAAILISLSLTNSDSTASAQKPARFAANTGAVRFAGDGIHHRHRYGRSCGHHDG